MSPSVASKLWSRVSEEVKNGRCERGGGLHVERRLARKLADHG